MALYWPRQKVALDIVDDPSHVPSTHYDDSWQVVRLTSDQVSDYASYRRVMSRLADLLARGNRDEGAQPCLPQIA